VQTQYEVQGYVKMLNSWDQMGGTPESPGKNLLKNSLLFLN
jgi:hypothetical protein